MNLRRPARLSLFVLLSVILAMIIVAPPLLAQASGVYTSQFITNALSGDAAYQNYNPDGPIFSNWQPATVASDPYQTISVNYSDPDGVAGQSTANVAKLWFDDYEATKCPRLGVTTTSSGISWNHDTVTIRGTGNCSAQADEFVPMTDGTHTVKVTATDLAGKSNTIQWTFILDRTPPTITPSPLCGSVSDAATPTISFDYSDEFGMNTSSAVMKLDGITVPAAAGAASAVYTPGSPLSDGSHTATLSIKDSAGNTGTSTCKFIVDQQPPVIDSITPADGATINSSSTTVSVAWHDAGAGADQYTAHLELDHTDVTGSAVLGQYGLTYPASGLTMGDHLITVYVKDKFGHQSATASSKFYFSDDTQAPVIDSLTPADGSLIYTPNPLIEATWHDLGSAGVDQYSAHLTLDGGDVSGSASVGQYGLSYLTSGLTPGSHTVFIYVKDKVGHKSLTRSTTFTYSDDSQAPVIDSITPADGATIASPDPLIQVSWHDIGSAGIDQDTAHLTLDNKDVTADATVTAGGLSYQATGLAMGDHTVTVYVKDNIGHQSETASSKFTYTTFNPDGPTFTDWQPAIAASDQYQTISVSYTDPDGVAGRTSPNRPRMWFDGYEVTKCLAVGVTWQANGFKWDHTTVTQWGSGCQALAAERMAMADGTHNVRVILTDNLGNQSMKEWSFKTDHTPPTVAPSDLCGTTVENTTPTISFAYSDQYGMDTSSAVMKLDGREVTADVGAAAAVYTPGTPLDEGPHTATLTVKDSAGNPSTSTCGFTVDSKPPVIDSIKPENGSRVGTPNPDIKVTWSDAGAGVDQYTAHLELDGKDVTSGASLAQYGLGYAASGLALGDHRVAVYVKDKSGHQSATASSTFRYSEPISYYAPWYDSKPENSMNGNWVLISNQEDTSAVVDVYIGDEKMEGPDGGHWNIPGNGRVTPSFKSTIGGPVKVVSTNGNELLVSQRVLFKDSFNEVMAVRESDLDSEYRFTWYDSKPENHMNGNWILIGNTDQSENAVVDVYIGDHSMGTWTVAPGGIVTPGGPGTPQFNNLMDGPVKVKSQGGQKLIVSQRVIYKNSFTEVMGTPASRLDKEYFFTWYDSKAENHMNGNWVLVSNENQNAAADVYIEIGGHRMNNPDVPGSDHFIIPAGSRITPQFNNLTGGPVHVGCASCDEYNSKIMASQRVIFKDSFEEVQGTRPADMSDSAVFTWYDFKAENHMNGNWILIGNQNASVDAYMQIHIGASSAPMKAVNGDSGFVAAKNGGSTTPSFPGVMDGPVVVTCTTCDPGQKLIISQRVIYLNSFNEVVGKPARKNGMGGIEIIVPPSPWAFGAHSIS